jgi:hypothetical protein
MATPRVTSSNGDPIRPCGRCGEVHTRCGAHRRDGRPCGRWPERGAPVCRQCGGGAPQVKAAAAARREQAAAAQAVVTYGLPRTVAPAAALLEEIARTAGHVDWLGVQVAAHPDPTAETSRPWVELYRLERRHLREVCRDAINAGVAERQVTLAEQQGHLMASVITAVLAELQLTPDQRALVATVVPRHLRAVEAG